MFGKKRALRVFESGAGFRWQLFEGKNLIAVSGEGFPDATSCEEAWFEGARMAVEYFTGGVVDRNRFDFRDLMGGVDWVFRSPSGEIVATSGLPLPTLRKAQGSAQKFSYAAMNRDKVPIVEQPPG